MSELNLLEFPCDFPMKIFGEDNEAFLMAATEIVCRHFPTFSPHELQKRPSKNHRYLALTAVVRAESQQQLDQAYLELNAHEAIVMTL